VGIWYNIFYQMEKGEKMRRLLFSLLIVFILSTYVSAQIEYVGFTLPEDESSENLYNLEPYYFLHYFYIDVLYFFGLLDQLDLHTKAEIFAKIFNNIGEGYPAGITVKFADQDEPLHVSYRVFANESSALVFMTTNFDFKNEEFLERYTLDCYVRIYNVFGDKLVNEYYLFSEEKEELYKANLNNLADLYIFDERVENDHLVEGLLLKYINSDPSLVSKFVGHLTFAQYYMLINDPEKARERLAEAEVLFANLEEKDKEDWGLPLVITKEEAQIIAQVKGALPQGENGSNE